MRLALLFLKSREPVYKMCLIFSVVPSTAYDWLDFSLEVLVQTIRRNWLGGAEVCCLIHEQIEASERLLRANREYSELLNGVFM